MADSPTSHRRLDTTGTHLFLLMCALVFISMCVWAYMGKLDIASVCEGRVIPSSKVKSIQHLEGGIIKDIPVNEGDRVNAGQPLVYLEEIANETSVEEINIRINALSIDIERLSQEIKGNDTLALPADLTTAHPDLAQQAKNLFSARHMRYSSEIKGQMEKIRQREQDIREITTRLKHNKENLALLEQQIRISDELLKDNLATQYTHLNLLREESKLKGRIEEDRVALERAQHSLNEEKEKQEGITHIFREDAREKLKKARQELEEYSQRRLKFKDSLERSVIRSPIDGVVKTLYMVTKGGIIRPGMTIMDIVPIKDRLIIEAHLPIHDIGYIDKGRNTLIKLASPEARRFGEIQGQVVNISPDTVTNRDGRTYYTIYIETENDRFERGNLTYRLYPGVMVLVFIHTGRRTIFEYLMDPFLNTLGNSLMER